MKDRRTFLKSLAAAAVVAKTSGSLAAQTRKPPSPTYPVPAPAAGTAAGIRKATLISMLPRDRSYLERFTIARDAGFEALEMQTIASETEAAEIREASQKTGLQIHSVMNSEHWSSPLSSADPEVVAKSVRGMETSLRNAALWGADTVLLVPAVVNPQTGYQDAWTRSQQVIRERLLPLATELKVIIGIEEVWNKFLLSPIEFARYVDDFNSPWVRAYFDVGNIVFYAYPQDWIRTLGKRIVKVHLKDFRLDRKSGSFKFVNVGEGDIDWPEVRKALSEIGYSGYVTTEVSGGDQAYLTDLARRVDRFLAGEKPVTGTV